MLGGLVGWYVYLHSQESVTTASDAARGLNTVTPSFGGSTGSTNKNQLIATGLNSGGTGQHATSSSPLWKVDSLPVAGMGFVVSSSSQKLYYVERANGYIFAADTNARSVTRLTDTLMPKVYEAMVSTDGGIVERSIDDSGNITTFLGSITSTSTARSQPSALIGSYLSSNIRSIALNKATRGVLYTLTNTQGGVDGFTQGWIGGKKTQVFSSLIGSWRMVWLPDGRMIATESPTDGMMGYAYQIGQNNNLTPLVRNVPGLMVTMQSGGHAFVFSSSDGNTQSLFGQASSTPELLSLQTVADKCVWLSGQSLIAYCAVPKAPPSGNFVTDWYMGLTHTTDNWWEVDLLTGTSKLIYSPSSDGVSIDVQNPMMDPSGTYISFTNGVDQSLWVLNVTQ